MSAQDKKRRMLRFYASSVCVVADYRKNDRMFRRLRINVLLIHACPRFFRYATSTLVCWLGSVANHPSCGNCVKIFSTFLESYISLLKILRPAGYILDSDFVSTCCIRRVYSRWASAIHVGHSNQSTSQWRLQCTVAKRRHVSTLHHCKYCSHTCRPSFL